MSLTNINSIFRASSHDCTTTGRGNVTWPGACITNEGDTYTWEDFPCKELAFNGVRDEEKKLAKGSVTNLDITIQVDFKSKSWQYFQLQFGNDMTIFVDVENNQTRITHQNRQEDSERRVGYVDIEDHKIDMTITIYVDNTSMTVYDTLSEMKTILKPISTYPILTREGTGIILKKIKYEKNISKYPQKIADHDDYVKKNNLAEIFKVRRIS